MCRNSRSPHICTQHYAPGSSIQSKLTTVQLPSSTSRVICAGFPAVWFWFRFWLRKRERRGALPEIDPNGLRRSRSDAVSVRAGAQKALESAFRADICELIGSLVTGGMMSSMCEKELSMVAS